MGEDYTLCRRRGKAKSGEEEKPEATRIMELELTDLHLPLRHPFTITHGTTTVQHNVLVGLRDGGVTGYGEAAPSRAYHLTPGLIRESLERVRGFLSGYRMTTPERLWEEVFPLLADNRFALCALDEAAHDLWGKREGQPVWKLWGLRLEDLPVSNYTIGIDTIERMVAKMEEFAGWPVYKIKLGTAEDLEIVRELRRHTGAVFRIDANTAWSVEQTLAYGPELKALGVEFIEQPLPRDDWEGMKRVKAGSVLPVMADESCQTEDDVGRCAGCFDGINIKLTKAGGMTAARRMIAEAKRLGLKVMVGCMNESSVGISAIGQLLPLLDYVDMDGSVLIARDIADGVRLEKGVAVFPGVPGNGVTLLE